MKTKSNIDKNDDIAIKIAIIETALSRYNLYALVSDDKIVPILIQQEEEKLAVLKQQYPEYFI